MSRTATDSTVLLGHGSGGQMMKRIIDEVFLDAFGSPELLEGNDAGVAALPASGRIAMSTDSFVVSPQFFPGGNIGRLAVCGTVNDVATSGANVRYLSCGFILEEGYPMDKLRQIVQTMAETAHEAGVKIITGDTKVVERGGADGVYINTAGVGEVPAGVTLSGANCRPGDVILVSGTLGDHGIAIMSQREGLAFSSAIESDAAPLNHLIADVLAAAPDTRCFRDPTRGGLASTLNEFAQASGVAMEIDEDAVPVRPDVQAACEMLGYDVMQVANEGKMVCVVAADEAEAALAAMRKSPYGDDAAIIGRVTRPTRPAAPRCSCAPLSVAPHLGHARRRAASPYLLVRYALLSRPLKSFLFLLALWLFHGILRSEVTGGGKPLLHRRGLSPENEGASHVSSRN